MSNRVFGKRGAIELSMTTIIVIIIGITLLSLALVWVKGTFSRVSTLSNAAFEQADGEISNIFGEADKPVFISPPSIELSQGDARRVDFTVTNFEEDITKIKAKVESSDKSIKCFFADTQRMESKEYALESGKRVELKVIVEETNGGLGVKVCNFEVPNLKNTNTESLIIDVVKKQGLFN